MSRERKRTILPYDNSVLGSTGRRPNEIQRVDRIPGAVTEAISATNLLGDNSLNERVDFAIKVVGLFRQIEASSNRSWRNVTFSDSPATNGGLKNLRIGIFKEDNKEINEAIDKLVEDVASTVSAAGVKRVIGLTLEILQSGATTFAELQRIRERRRKG